MKKLFLLALVVLFSSCASNTSFNTFYKDNHENSDFSLGLNSSLIRAFIPDEDMEDIKPILKKAKHVRILVFSENSAKMSSKFSKFIKRSNFDKLVKIKDDSDKLSLYALEEKDKIKEIVVEIYSDGDLVLLGLKTNLSQKDIEKLFDDDSISLN